LKKDRVFVILEQNSKLGDDEEKLVIITDPVTKFPMTDDSPEEVEVSEESKDDRNYMCSRLVVDL
jgi:hypothetical protein